MYSAILIDDEAWTRTALRKLGNWEALGIEIIAEASDGEYGMELITRLNPDIVITDVKMPHMNGLELLEELRGRGNNAKVVFVSGFDDFEFVRKAMKLQATDYLLKPVKPEELNEQLSRCADELSMQKSESADRDLDLQGFMNVEWVREYTALRGTIYESLRSNNAFILREAFERLIRFICRKEDIFDPKSLAICMYYDFHNWLQRYIWENGYGVNDIFGEDTVSFVFSNDFSLANMLEHIKSLYCGAQQRVVGLVRSKKRIDIGKIKQYIDANYCDGITLEETAARFYISKEYLSKVFKLESGVSFSDYVLSLRMKKAMEMLTHNKVPIKEIAMLTGYSDQAHFHKAFKKYFCVTPGELQRKVID